MQPWLLVDGADGSPVGYGELWLDAEEDEVELARLIVDPARRRSGQGRALVAALVDGGRGDRHVRLPAPGRPGQRRGHRLYRAAGFAEVDPERTGEWNQGQPTEYVWFEWVSR